MKSFPPFANLVTGPLDFFARNPVGCRTSWSPPLPWSLRWSPWWSQPLHGPTGFTDIPPLVNLYEPKPKIPDFTFTSRCGPSACYASRDDSPRFPDLVGVSLLTRPRIELPQPLMHGPIGGLNTPPLLGFA